MDTIIEREKRRVVVCAAIRNRVSGSIICGARHFDEIMRKQIENSIEIEAWKSPEQGFIDQFGNFLTREIALEIATEKNQIIRRVGGDDDKLFSENLY